MIKLYFILLKIFIQETGSKTIPKKKKCKNAKWLSEEALQMAVKRREASQFNLSETVGKRLCKRKSKN